VPVGADVARHLPDLLVRDVQPVVTAEGEEEIVARDPRDGLRLEAEELPDAVVLVDDEVARAQVGEALQSAADPRVGPRRTLAEDLRVREEDEAEIAQDEAAPRGCDGEEEPFSVRELVAGREDRRVDAAEQGLGPEGLAGRAKVTTTRFPPRTNARRSRSASESPRAATAGRWASKAYRWPAGSWLSSVAPPRPS
jgi:hypothetical protein